MSNRTWKDAACEVGFRKMCTLHETELLKRYFCFFNVKDFLAGIFATGTRYFYGSNYIKICDDFSTFRAAFMKWLEDNEVKPQNDI